jgi:hypothetical protein
MAVGTFTVLSASYDGSFPTPQSGQAQADPLICVQGTLSGFSGWFPSAGVVSNFSFKFVTYLFWNQIQNANIASGTAGVQSLIAAQVQNFWLGLSVPLPTFPAATSIPAPVTGGGASAGYLGGTTCWQALVGSWSA